MAKRLGLGQYSIQYRVFGNIGEEEIDKSWPRDLGLLYGVVSRDSVNDALSKLAGWFSCRFSQHHRKVGGEIAVRTILGASHLDSRAL